MNSFLPLSASDEVNVNTKFTLFNINVYQLESQYLMNDIQDASFNQLVDGWNTSSVSFTSNPVSLPTTTLYTAKDTLSKVTSSLESMGMSKARTKPYETIIMNDELNIRLFISPSSTQSTASPDAKCMSEMKKNCCWYCRHTFSQEWYPIGIPIRHKIDSTKTHCFECEGVFCSFNCCIAYLNEHHEYRFKDSCVLLLLMYRKINKCFKLLSSITPSPSWKLLREYGGHLSIEDYRKCFQHLEYKSMQQLLFKQELKVQTGAELFIEV